MNELVIMKDQQAVTTSLIVAEQFGKRHADIIRAIENKLSAKLRSVEEMLVEGTFKDKSGKQNKMYYMNRDGFSFIAFGFTGAEADSFKLKYIQAFNAMEKQLTNPVEQLLANPAAIGRMMIDYGETKEQLAIAEQRIAEYEPKIDYLDTILASSDMVTTTQIAADYGMSAIAFNRLLNRLGVQRKVGEQWILYTKYMNNGYTDSDTKTIPDLKHGGMKVVMNTKWLQKGRVFIYNLLKANDIVPESEREN